MATYSGSDKRLQYLFQHESGGSLEDLDDVEITSVEDGQGLVYDEDSGKWVNGEGGGGNANEQVLTKAEYDALTEEQKMNNTTYYINDADTWTSKEVQPVIYSTEEREIGVWIDGKPLYQKTISFGQLPTANGSKSIAHNISNFDFMRVESFFAVQNGYYTNMPYVSYVSNVGGGEMYLTNTDIVVRTGTLDLSGYTQSYVTIQYTKTTDQAGSGIYTPQGQLAVHYSTDEHVIGTWIDGSTLYEKSIVLNSSFTASTDVWTDLNITLGNIEIRDSIAYRPNNKGTYNPVATRCRTDNYYIGFLFCFNVTFPVGSVFTIQYTKNT